MGNCVGLSSELEAKGQLSNDLLPPLRRLDQLLQNAVVAAQDVYGPEATLDPFRGLHITRDEVERLLHSEPGAPFLRNDGEGEDSSFPDTGESRFAWLKEAFGLSRFELDLVIIALAPEIDLRYERLYAYLQDDVTRRKPAIDLALNLLCSSANEKLSRRAHFTSDAPLICHNLIHLVPDPNQLKPPLLAQFLKLDDQIIRLLLCHEGLDSRLRASCEMLKPSISMNDLLISADLKRALPFLADQAHRERRPLRLYFHGPGGSGKKRTAEAMAGESGRWLLVADLSRAPSAESDFEEMLRVLFREAWFSDALLYLEGLDSLRSEEKAVPWKLVLKALGNYSGVTILAGNLPWVPTSAAPPGVLPVSFVSADFIQRRANWQASLTQHEIQLSIDDLDSLAERFRITSHQIADAVATAHNRAFWQAAAVPGKGKKAKRAVKPNVGDLFAAARSQSGSELASLAQKVEPKYGWDDIVLPDDALTQLREICQRVTHRHRVMNEWGFDRKLSLGKGVNALFAGPSGTGKTMAAEVIANELGLDLYKIDLSGVVSKYIGETEKNLNRIFAVAESANAILFFDEADALFGKRSEVRDSHDRYANIEISYLLQKMEQYEGITILATNLRQNMDDAFVRRLAFTVNFPFPDQSQRCRIWAGILPTEIALAKDVDLGFMAGQFKLSGGNIKNVALSAAFLAAADGGQVNMAHLFHATQREYQKLGKTLSEAELYGEWKWPLVASK